MPVATRSRVPVGPKPRNDAYVGLLIVSLLAMIAGCVLLYLDYSQYSGTPPKGAPQVQRPAAGGGAAPAGQPGGAGIQGAPPGAAAQGGAGAQGAPPGAAMQGGAGAQGMPPPGAMQGGAGAQGVPPGKQ